jgi:hypothetical protein
MGLFIGGNLYADDLIDKEALIRQEIQDNLGLGASSEASSVLQEIAEQLKSQLVGTASKQARAGEPRSTLTNDSSRLTAFLGATWRFNYNIGSSSFSETIICNSTIVTTSEGQIALPCKTSDNLYVVAAVPYITGGVFVYIDNALKAAFALDPSSNYCNGASGIYMASAISTNTYPATATRLSGPTCTTPSAPSNGVLITPDIWINAEIQTVEKGSINAAWHLGGDSYTSRGDRVIWGYFYASSNDVSWGSQNNPDLYLKAWYDVSGRIDVNFFHVSVPEIKVYSAKNNGGILTDTATMDYRYIRHTYNANNTEDTARVDTRNASVVNAEYPLGKIDDVVINNLINTVEKGAISAKIGTGGGDATSRGDAVIWGYYYACL